MKILRQTFFELPLTEKMTGPLYWIQEQGNTEARDKEYVNIMIEGGNGHCTIESRLKPSWFEIVDLILNEMRNKGAKAYIFDEAWFPSFDAAGQVPEQYRCKMLNCSSEDTTGPVTYRASGYGGVYYIKTAAGKLIGDKIDAYMLSIYSPFIYSRQIHIHLVQP